MPPATNLSVVVVVGTDHHPFDRLVTWVDTWLQCRPGGPVSCLVQYGTSASPLVAQGRPYLDHAGVEQLMAQALAVITHGGPTTIAEARRAGHRPVVVPRSARLGEHVDDHQRRFVGRLASAGLVDVAHTQAELAAAVETRLRAVTAPGPTDVTAEWEQSARRFGRLVEEVLGSRKAAR